MNGFIDARCGCERCRERTENVYRMVGRCRNCGTGDLLILYRAGDRAADQDCPVCGNWKTVIPARLATPDEIPAMDESERLGSLSVAKRSGNNAGLAESEASSDG